MKVTLLSEQYAPDIGGIQNYLSHLMAGISGRHEVTVIGPPLTSEAELDVPYSIERRQHHVPFVWPRWLFLYLLLRKRAARGELDMLLCGKALYEGLVGYLLKKRFGTPYIVCTYAMEIGEWSKSSRTRKKLVKVLGNADRVVYINDVTKKQLSELGVAEDRLIKITPGVDARFFNNVAPELASATARYYGVKQPYILSVGRLIRRKGFDTLITAFSKLDQTKYANLQLVIVGAGEDKDYLEKTADEQLVATSVKLLSDVPAKHLPPLYAGAELFVLTPREIEGDYEGFGIVYQEASAQGTPSIASSSGGVPEAVTDTETGVLVEPDDPDQLAAQIERLLADDQTRKRLGAKAKEQADWDFRWNERYKQLLELLSEINSA